MEKRDSILTRIVLRCILMSTVPLVLLLAGPVRAQAFRVQPMRVEAELPPGRVATIPLQVSNSSGTRPQVVELILTDLAQGAGGTWSPIPPDANRDTSHLMSCRAWIELEEDEIEIAAQQNHDVTLRMSVPPAARGTYTAALLVQSRPLGDPEAAVRLQVRFLVPLIISIEGRPVRRRVELEEISMRFEQDDREGDRSRTTFGGMRIANRGRTFSRVRGEMRMEMQQGERWRPVTTIHLDERSILPGVTLELNDDLDRRLPSGTYRLRGHLYVDGRRESPMEKVIEFEGDPQAETLALDTALRLEPEQLDVEASPGAVRTGVIAVKNPSEDRISVRAAALLPDSLKGVAMGELEGEELSAADWVQIRPEMFTLRPEGRQNLRVITRVPRVGIEHARYYADLVLQAAYQDGQSAGVTRSMLTVANTGVPVEPRLVLDRLTLAKGDEKRYIVQGQVVNVGNVHLSPTADAELLDAGGNTAGRPELSGDGAFLLPMQVRRFAGVIDTDELEAGEYLLRAGFDHDGVTLTEKQIAIEVTQEGQRGMKLHVRD